MRDDLPLMFFPAQPLDVSVWKARVVTLREKFLYSHGPENLTGNSGAE